MPPPEGFVSPMTWGVADHVIERFAAAGCLQRTFRTRTRSTLNALGCGSQRPRGGPYDELNALFNAKNPSVDENATSIPATT
jgi:hypothetical protein